MNDEGGYESRRKKAFSFSFSRLLYHALGGKKPQDALPAPPGTRARPPACQAAITWHAGGTLGLSAHGRPGEQTQEASCAHTSSHVTCGPQFPFLTNTRGCPGGALSLRPPRALPPAPAPQCRGPWMEGGCSEGPGGPPHPSGDSCLLVTARQSRRPWSR